MKNILITGGMGYVGCPLTNYLVDKGHNVTVLDLMIYGENLLPKKKNLKVIKGDIRDQKLLKDILPGHDTLIHLACISNDPSFELNPNLGKSINLTSFEPIVEISIKSKIKTNGGVMKNAIAMADVSGSMCGRPMEVSIALSLIVAELSDSVYHNRILTFETNPHWIVLNEDEDLRSKVKKVQNAEWGGSTNIIGAFELILEQAEKGSVPISEFPDVFFVFSDMQFNAAQPLCERTHLERLKIRFAEVGKKICGVSYSLPRIVFWNLRGNTIGFQSKANDSNVQELSGYSPSLFKYVTNLTLDTIDSVAVIETPMPADTLDAILADDAFLPVRYAISDLTCGQLSSYKIDKDDDDFIIIDSEENAS